MAHPDLSKIGAIAPQAEGFGLTTTQEANRPELTGMGFKHMTFNAETGKIFFVNFFMNVIIASLITGISNYSIGIGRIIGIDMFLSFILVLYRDYVFGMIKNQWAYVIAYTIFFSLDVVGMITYMVYFKMVDWNEFNAETTGFIEYVWLRPSLLLGYSLISLFVVFSAIFASCCLSNRK